MIFSIDRDVLLENLAVIQRGLPAKTPMPILSGIKIEVFEQELYMVSNNTDILIQVNINDSSLKVEKPGSVVIPGKYFIEIVRKITSRKIELNLIEEHVLCIKADRSEFKLRILDILDYPDVDFLPLENPLVLESKLIKTIIRETTFAAAISEKKPILSGVNFKNSEESLNCIATDTFRLSQKTVYLEKPYPNFNIVIPTKSLEELWKSLDNYYDDVEIYLSKTKALFKFKNILFQTRLLDGTYPDTSRLMPKEFSVIIKFNKDELIQALERVSLLSPKDKENNYNIIRLKLRKDQIVEMTSTNSEIGDALEEIIPSDTVIGETINIAFNSKYLADAIKTYLTNEVSLKFIGESRPFLIMSEKDLNLTNLILPVKID